MRSTCILLIAVFSLNTQAEPAPLLEYRFDENPGFTVYDSGSSGIDAQNIATPDYTAPIWSAGRTGTGMQFNGSGDLINLGDRDELDLQRYTIMTWVVYHNPPPSLLVPGVATRGTQRNYEIVEKIGAYWLNIRLDTGLLRSGGRFGGPEQDGCTDPLYGLKESVDSSAPVPEDQWTHVATTYNGSKLKVYINGRLKASKEVSGGKCDSPFEVVIGAKYTAMPYKSWQTGFVNNNFNGTMDDFRVYDAALSGEDIRDVIASASPLPGNGEFHVADATADTHTRDTSKTQNKNYGSTKDIRVHKPGAKTSFVNFNLDAVSGVVESAILNLHVKNVRRPGNIAIQAIEESWAENSVTAANEPGFSSSPITSFEVVSADEGSVISIDVTPLVSGWVDDPSTQFGIAMTHIDLVKVEFFSRESGNPAFLKIQTR